MRDDARRVVLILMDGARPDVIRELLDRGDLPNLARHVVEPGGMTVGTTTFPSTTGVAYIPFLYGRYPGSLGIPGIRWFDRTEPVDGLSAQWRAARSYCGVQAGWFDRDTAAARSLFDLVPSLAICTPITRGLAPGAHRIPTKRALLGSLAHYAGTYLWLDRAVSRAWLAAASEPWRFLFVVYPGPDGITHLEDPFHTRVLQSYREIDAALGAFMARAAQHGPLPDLIVASDHGATAMPNHTDIALHLESWGWPTVRHPVHVWRRNARAAVMVSGNASVQLYFEPRAGRRTPRTAGELPDDVVERLIELQAVRLAAYRGEDDAVIVRSRDGLASLREVGSRIVASSIAGDPLGLGGDALDLDDADMLVRSRATDLPDAPRQLLQLFRTDRSGDLVLAAGSGFDFRGPWEIPEHRAGHGSLIAEHMNVPILMSVPVPAAPLRTVDLMPTVLGLLGEDVPEELDGRPRSAVESTAAST